MSIPYEFLLATTGAQTYLASDRALRDEVVWPAYLSYELLVRRLFAIFLDNSALESVTLTSFVQCSFDEDASSQTARFEQSLKLTAIGPTGLDSIEAKAEFLADNAPVHRMGTGSFTMQRSNGYIQRLLEQPSGQEADLTFLMLAQQAQRSFKELKTDLVGNTLLG